MNNTLAIKLYVLGLGLLLLAERFFGPGHDLRLYVAYPGFLLTVIALGLRIKRWSSAEGGTKLVLGRLVPAYGVAVFGLLLYVAALADGPLGLEGDTRTVLRVLWPIVWLSGTLPVLAMEYSLRSMLGAQRLETRRLLESGRAGLTLALALSWLVALNFVANDQNKRIDMRTIKNLMPSAATLEMVNNLSEPLEITLFFPPANDVAEQIAPYFEALDDASEQLSIERLDRDMVPKRAKELRARKNGTVVLSRGTNHESVVLETNPDKARRKLKKLDRDIQSKLSKIVREQRVAFIVQGHGERSTSPKSGDAEGLKTLKELLKRLNYKVKKLGINEGLGNDVPEEATVVFVVGPTGAMLDVEQRSLIRFLDRGGALVLALDPEIDEDLALDPLLKHLGVRFDPTPLVHESKFVPFKRNQSDRTFLFSNRFTAHDSTKILSKMGSRVVLLFPTTGSLEKHPDPDEGAKVQFVVRSMSGTFADKDGDLEFDKDTEKKAVHQLIAAVQLPAPDEEGKKGGRAIVTADADLISDLVLGSHGPNQQWIADALHWLEDEVQLSAEVAELEDVPLLHSRDEDKAWFWGTTAGAPLLVLLLGVAIRRRREDA